MDDRLIRIKAQIEAGAYEPGQVLGELADHAVCDALDDHLTNAAPRRGGPSLPESLPGTAPPLCLFGDGEYERAVHDVDFAELIEGVGWALLGTAAGAIVGLLVT